MAGKFITISGSVIQGHRVASGPSNEYPYGSLERQKPFFKAGGLNLDRFYAGTLNISISPLEFEMVRPAYTFHQIAWTNLHPPEDFSFSPCIIMFDDNKYEGFVYYPHPETKIRHFQSRSMIEVITDLIPGIGYGSHVRLAVLQDEIRII
jgi:hypothetical protein